MNVNLLHKLEATRKRKEKETLLYQTDLDDQLLLEYAFDPSLGYAFPSISKDKVLGNGSDDIWGEFLNVIKRLSRNEDVKDDEVIELLKSGPVEAAELALRILNKDIRSVTLSDVQRVLPDLVQTLKLSEAIKFNTKKHIPLKGTWYVEPKLKGMRVVIIGGFAYTRNGRRVTSIDPIIEELRESLDLRECVVDGEVTINARGQYVDPLNDVYHVYDLILRDNWNKTKTRELYKRKESLQRLIQTNKSVKVVPWYGVPPNYNKDELFDFLSIFSERGYPGCYLKDANSTYWTKNSLILNLK